MDKINNNGIKEFTLDAPNGNYKIYAIKSTATTPVPVATLVLVHGLGEHCRRYDHFIAACNEAGISVVSFDLPGHGSTLKLNPDTMVIGHFKITEIFDCIDLIAANEKELSTEKEEIPLFLFGHSLGGLLVLAYSLLKKKQTCPVSFTGVICSAPALAPGTKIPFLKYHLGKLLSKIFSTLTVSNGLELNNLSRDPAIVQEYRRDPLVHAQISLDAAANILKLGEEVQSLSKKVDFNLLLAHGTKDKLTSFDASKTFIENVPEKEKVKFVAYSDSFHELHNDTNKEEVIQMYIDWIISKSNTLK